MTRRSNKPPVIWSPQPKQTEALTRREFEVLYGGARGGGKTDAGMAWMLYYKDHPRFRGLVIRKNADDLKDWVDRAQWMYSSTGARFTGKPVEIEFPCAKCLTFDGTHPGHGCAKIRTGHLKDENAYQKYQGHEYQRVLIEELTQIPEEKYYIQLISSCRSTIDIPPRVFCTTNPDGPGFDWVKKRWNIPDWPPPIVETPTPEGGRVFILAKLEDNPKLDKKDVSYRLRLEAIPDESLRKAWLNGYWGEPIVEGSIYRQEIARARDEGRITEVPWNPRHPVYTYWDIGRDATPILFMQKIGAAWHLIDFYEAQNQSFEHFASVLRSKPYWYGGHFGPHDLAKTDMAGESIWKLAVDYGINFTIGPKDSIADGIQAVKMKFPLLKIDAVKGAEFIKRITAYRRAYDDEKGVFKDVPVHDWASHASDALRLWAVLPEPLLPGDLEQNFSLYAQSYK